MFYKYILSFVCYRIWVEVFYSYFFYNTTRRGDMLAHILTSLWECLLIGISKWIWIVLESDRISIICLPHRTGLINAPWVLPANQSSWIFLRYLDSLVRNNYWTLSYDSVTAFCLTLLIHSHHDLTHLQETILKFFPQEAR